MRKTRTRMAAGVLCLVASVAQAPHAERTTDAAWTAVAPPGAQRVSAGGAPSTDTSRRASGKQHAAAAGNVAADPLPNAAARPVTDLAGTENLSVTPAPLLLPSNSQMAAAARLQPSAAARGGESTRNAATGSSRRGGGPDIAIPSSGGAPISPARAAIAAAQTAPAAESQPPDSPAASHAGLALESAMPVESAGDERMNNSLTRAVEPAALAGPESGSPRGPSTLADLAAKDAAAAKVVGRVLEEIDGEGPPLLPAPAAGILGPEWDFSVADPGGPGHAAGVSSAMPLPGIALPMVVSSTDGLQHVTAGADLLQPSSVLNQLTATPSPFGQVHGAAVDAPANDLAAPMQAPEPSVLLLAGLGLGALYKRGVHRRTGR